MRKHVGHKNNPRNLSSLYISPKALLYFNKFVKKKSLYLLVLIACPGVPGLGAMALTAGVSLGEAPRAAAVVTGAVALGRMEMEVLGSWITAGFFPPAPGGIKLH